MAEYTPCYLLENDIYREVSHTFVFDGRTKRREFANRHFIFLQGLYLEVPVEEYKETMSQKARREYLYRLAKEYKLVSYQALISEAESSGKSEWEDKIACNREIDVESEAIDSAFVSDFLKTLDQDERLLTILLTFNELTERECAKIFCVSQKAINKRKHKIREKLKKYINN